MPIDQNQPEKPLALIVLLENIGHIQGFNLTQWMMNVVDFVTEEYAKILLRLLGAHRRYDRIIILEDEEANAPTLANALIEQSQTHQLDVLLLVHGYEHMLLGFKGEEYVGPETFEPLIELYQKDPTLLDLRMVYGVNCYGASLAPCWLDLGAKAVNGAIGVNCMPEPSLSIFLFKWLRGAPYSQAVQQSSQVAHALWRQIWRPDHDGQDHINVSGSRQIIFGQRDVTI